MVKLVKPKPGTSITWTSNKLEHEITKLQEQLELIRDIGETADLDTLHQLEAAISYRKAILTAISVH